VNNNKGTGRVQNYGAVHVSLSFILCGVCLCVSATQRPEPIFCALSPLLSLLSLSRYLCGVVWAVWCDTAFLSGGFVVCGRFLSCETFFCPAGRYSSGHKFGNSSWGIFKKNVENPLIKLGDNSSNYGQGLTCTDY
jgi:hypothetical protein